MSIIGQNILAGASGGGVEEYTIDQSLRFNSDDDCYLSKTLGAGSLRKWTISAWVKRCGVSSDSGNGNGQSDNPKLYNSSGGGYFNFQTTAATFYMGDNGGTLHTTDSFRDPNAWYHIVVTWDSDNATAGERYRLYVNGDRITDFATETQPAINTDSFWNSATEHDIGSYIGARPDTTPNMYLADFASIDGQALSAASFGKINTDTGQWVPKNALGNVYGSNGFLLRFEDAADLGNDTTPNGNDFAVTNLVASDQVPDSPNNNYCTMDPLTHFGDGVFSEGNLGISGGDNTLMNFSPHAGKWYWEVLITGVNATGNHIGIMSTDYSKDTAQYNEFDLIGIRADMPSGSDLSGVGRGQGITAMGSNTATLAGFVVGDVLSFELNLDTPQIIINKNDSPIVNRTFTYDNRWPVLAWIRDNTGGNSSLANFGQDSSFAGNKTAAANTDDNDQGEFYYDVPAGFLALCQSNMTDPSIPKSTAQFNVIAFDDGAGAKTGIGFQPDLVWLKSRGSAYEHELTDVIRGVTKALSADSALVESTDSTGLTAFGADGFTVGADTNYSDTTGTGMVGWNWKGGGTGVANTDGGINSTVSVNSTAGFSIVKYTGTGSAATVGHGLSVQPGLVIVKGIDGAYNWRVGGEHIGLTDMDRSGQMNLDNAEQNLSGVWNGTAPTASVFTIGNDAGVNNTNTLFIAYCFHNVAGYQKIAKYVGNGSAEGPFLYCGFRPAFLITKRWDAAGDWRMKDRVRNPYNVARAAIFANTTAAETTGNKIDFVANGVKIRNSGGSQNASGGRFMWWAIAEFPFKTTNAR